MSCSPHPPTSGPRHAASLPPTPRSPFARQPATSTELLATRCLLHRRRRRRHLTCRIGAGSGEATAARAVAGRRRARRRTSMPRRRPPACAPGALKLSLLLRTRTGTAAAATATAVRPGCESWRPGGGGMLPLWMGSAAAAMLVSFLRVATQPTVSTIIFFRIKQTISDSEPRWARGGCGSGRSDEGSDDT